MTSRQITDFIAVVAGTIVLLVVGYIGSGLIRFPEAF